MAIKGRYHQHHFTMEALLPGLIGVIYLHTFKKLLRYQPKISRQQRANHVRFWHLSPERVL